MDAQQSMPRLYNETTTLAYDIQERIARLAQDVIHQLTAADIAIEKAGESVDEHVADGGVTRGHIDSARTTIKHLQQCFGNFTCP